MNGGMRQNTQIVRLNEVGKILKRPLTFLRIKLNDLRKLTDVVGHDQEIWKVF